MSKSGVSEMRFEKLAPLKNSVNQSAVVPCLVQYDVTQSLKHESKGVLIYGLFH